MRRCCQRGCLSVSCFDNEAGPQGGRAEPTNVVAGQFTWAHDQTALDYETRLLAGRYVITTSLTPDQASTANIYDPDLPDQLISARRALAELNRIRVHPLDTGDHHVQVITRRNPFQASICAALGLDTSTWSNARAT